MLSYLAFALCICLSQQHGYLIDPPARSSAWLLDKDFYDCCKNYNHNEMFCGGTYKLWYKNGGLCGICGEEWNSPKEYEKGGSKYLGKIMHIYQKGSVLNATVQITANHLGFFEFRLCNIDNWVGDATQECLNKTILRMENSDQVKHYIRYEDKLVNYQLTLPENLTCDHCVLQWKWTTGNSWGHDDVKNISCVGCGVIQEQFFGCADISIVENIEKTTKKTTEKKIEKTTEKTTLVTKLSTETFSTNEENSTNDFIVDILLTSKKSNNVFVKTTTKSQIDSDNDFNSNLKKTCVSRLEFGSTYDISSLLTLYCNKMCYSRCKFLTEEFQKNKNQEEFKNGPTVDLIACLDTCPILCACDQ